MLLVGVHHPDSTRHFVHAANSAQGGFQLVFFPAQRQQFLFGSRGTGDIVEVDLFQLFESLQPLVHGIEVGKHAAQPPVSHVRHTHAGGLLLHTFLRLLLGADEQHRSAVSHGLAHELIGSIDARERTLQIDDVDTVALRHDEAIHFGIPAPSLVAEVHTGLEQLTNCDDSHDTSFQRRSAARSVTASTRCASP